MNFARPAHRHPNMMRSMVNSTLTPWRTATKEQGTPDTKLSISEYKQALTGQKPGPFTDREAVKELPKTKLSILASKKGFDGPKLRSSTDRQVSRRGHH